jgi:Ca-activated chloride channel family protein
MSRSRNIAVILGVLSTALALLLWWYFKGKYSYYHPGFFWLLVLVPIAGIHHIWAVAGKHPKVQLSSLNQFPEKGQIATEISVQLPFLLRMAALSLLVIALARPQSQLSWQDVTTEGIDIVISMDISASMLAQDFRPNRLEKSKEVAVEFINSRPNDRIGLVVYEGESFTQCPLTSDHRVLVSLFKDVRTGMVQGGTAIGMGLATAVNRLRESEARSKVIILTTDGENNGGSVDPLTAAEIAKSYGIRVYTIGVGTKGRAKSPVGLYPDGTYKYDLVEVKINEEMLTEIAGMTGGAYFRATDGDALEKIFAEIDTLEKTKINVTEHRRKKEEYFLLLVIGAGLLLLEFLYKQLYLRTLP